MKMFKDYCESEPLYKGKSFTEEQRELIKSTLAYQLFSLKYGLIEIAKEFSIIFIRSWIGRVVLKTPKRAKIIYYTLLTIIFIYVLASTYMTFKYGLNSH